jgi:peptidylprolyl isomerase
MRRTLIVLACLALVVAGCSKKKESAAPAAPTCSDPATATGDAKTKPVIKVPDCKPPSSLQKVDLITGTGADAKAGGEVTVHYIGVSWTTKQEFDASWDNGQPISFALAGLIKGWQEGIPGMKVGGRRMLTIPPELGYGAAGRPPKIPGNDTLVFVIDLLKA